MPAHPTKEEAEMDEENEWNKEAEMEWNKILPKYRAEHSFSDFKLGFLSRARKDAREMEKLKKRVNELEDYLKPRPGFSRFI